MAGSKPSVKKSSSLLPIRRLIEDFNLGAAAKKNIPSAKTLLLTLTAFIIMFLVVIGCDGPEAEEQGVDWLPENEEERAAKFEEDEEPEPLPLEPVDWSSLIVAYTHEGGIMLKMGEETPYKFLEGPGDYNPSLAPDGQSMIFNRVFDFELEFYEDGIYSGSGHELWVAEIPSGQTRVLANQNILRKGKGMTVEEAFPILLPWRLTWLDEGSTVAFTLYYGMHVYNITAYDLLVADLVESVVTEVLPDQHGGHYAFSPDRHKVVVADSSSVSLADANGENRSEVLTFEPFPSGYEISFTPQPVWAEDSSYALVAIPDPYPMGPGGGGSFSETAYTTIWQITAEGALEALFDIYWPVMEDIVSGTLFSPDGRYVFHQSLELEERISQISSIDGTLEIPFPPAAFFGWATDSEKVLLMKDELYLAGIDGTIHELQFEDLESEIAEIYSLHWISPDRFVALADLDSGETILFAGTTGGETKIISTGLSPNSSFDAVLVD